MSEPSHAAKQRTTHQVFDHHLQAFAEGLDAIVSDYTDRSVILLPDATHAGLTAIRGFFAGFLASTPPGFWEAFRIVHQSVEGDVAYLVWEARPFVERATDTLVIRHGAIEVQTFTPFAASGR